MFRIRVPQLWLKRRILHSSQARAIRACRLTGSLLLFPALATCDSGVTGPEEKSIGEEGGAASLAGGSVRLSIPSNSLSGVVKFAATQASSFPASDLIVPGSVYDILPTETTFARLAQLTLSYDPQNVPGGVQESELRLFKVIGGRWELVLHATVDTQSRTVSGSVSSLGRFAARGVSVERVLVSTSTFTLEEGQTKELTAAGLDASGMSLPGRQITWTSSNESAATVDADGLVTAVGVGSATITANAEGKTASAEINTWNCSWQTEIPASECRALIALFSAANWLDWRGSPSWVPTPYPCEWLGVTCEGGSVSKVFLSNRHLPGFVSSSIGDLVNLTELDLSTNELTGPLPHSLGDLSELKLLDLSQNQFSGSIPSEFQRLSNLTVVDLAHNEFSGPIPPALGGLSDLRILNLGWNQVSGPIPPELGHLSNLTDLSLIDNQLSGSIPLDLGDLLELTSLSLAFNQLTGPIPPELGRLSKLTSLGVSHNQLSGPIPDEIGSLTKLEWLILYANDLSGPVPLAVAQLGGQIQAGTGGAQQCVFTPPGNTGLSMPDTQDYHDADLNGDGKICGIRIGS